VYWLSRRCLDGGLKRVTEGRADGTERSADSVGQSAHTGYSAKGDQSNNQSVFNQILAFLAIHQVL
jgi:hypothetical protein